MIDQQELADLSKKFLSIGKKVRREAGRTWPPSLDPMDVAQEGICLALKYRSKWEATRLCAFSTYMYRHVWGAAFRMIEASRVGPTNDAIKIRRKKGDVTNYSEISVHSIDKWEDWLDEKLKNDNTKEVNFVDVPVQAGAACLQDLQRRINNMDDVGIYYEAERPKLKRKAKYRVEISVCGRRQYVGAYPTKQEAMQAKKQFLQDFFNIVIESLADGNGQVAVCRLHNV